MEFYVEGRSRAARYVENLLPSMLAQLNLTRSRKLLHIKLDPELEDLGTTVPPVSYTHLTLPTILRV